MEPSITPIDATLGAVVTDLDLARMDAPTWKTVEQAFRSAHADLEGDEKVGAMIVKRALEAPICFDHVVGGKAAGARLPTRIRC